MKIYTRTGDTGETALFDNSRVSKADPRLQDRYGRNSFGWSLLTAARLVEAGVSLVQVNLGNNETWDTHESAFPNLKNFLFPPTDKAVSALLDDLQSRGLLDSTLIVVLSEFGRTAHENGNRGTDHGHGNVMWVMGGRVAGGRVYGQWPGLSAEALYQKRDLAVTTDFRSVLGAVLTMHMGVDAATLAKIFPGQPEMPEGLSGLIGA